MLRGSRTSATFVIRQIFAIRDGEIVNTYRVRTIGSPWVTMMVCSNWAAMALSTVRYADDCNIYVTPALAGGARETERAGERVVVSRRYLLDRFPGDLLLYPIAQPAHLAGPVFGLGLGQQQIQGFEQFGNGALRRKDDAAMMRVALSPCAKKTLQRFQTFATMDNSVSARFST